MRGIKIIERFSPDRPLLYDLIVAVQIEQFDGDRLFSCPISRQDAEDAHPGEYYNKTAARC